MEINFQFSPGPINIQKPRNLIMAEDLNEENTIVLNPSNFDDMVMEYRATYNEAIPIPFVLLGVSIEENKTNSLPKNKIRIC